MQGFIMAAQVLLGLSILIILHELGHYLTARMFGIRVEKFYLFFDAWGFKLFRFKKGDTEYGIGWLPLGGYVKISGMIDESLDTQGMQAPPQAHEFRSKPAWQRLVVMLGGVTVNLILGVIIFAGITLSHGEEKIPVDPNGPGIVAGPLAQQVGLQTGDVILAVNDKPIQWFQDLMSSDVLLGGASMTVLREGQELQVRIPDNFMDLYAHSSGEGFIEMRYPFQVQEVQAGTPAQKAGIQKGDRIVQVDGISTVHFDEFKSALAGREGQEVALLIVRQQDSLWMQAQVSPQGTLGFLAQPIGLETVQIKHGLWASLGLGTQRAFGGLWANIRGIGKVVTGQVSAQKSLMGPIGIAKIYGGEWDWLRFWSLTGMLSMILAFMNVLPIPALDGGHALFLIAEMVAGRPLSDKFLQGAQVAGMIILGLLMVFIFGNDILNLLR